jgi:hypothetical protein
MTKFQRLCSRVLGPNPMAHKERDLLVWAHDGVVYRVQPGGMNGIGAFLSAHGPTWSIADFRIAERDVEPEEVAVLRRMPDPERGRWAEAVLLPVLPAGAADHARWGRAIQRNDDARAIARLLAETQ